MRLGVVPSHFLPPPPVGSAVPRATPEVVVAVSEAEGALEVLRGVGCLSDAAPLHISLSRRRMSTLRPPPPPPQAVLNLNAAGTDVELATFPATHAGVVDSFNARYPAEDAELEALWRAERAAHAL